MTGNITWEYGTSPGEKFFSNTRGAAQRLPNGNTLIVNSNKGHVFEITPQKEIVWEFYSYRLKENMGERHALYRMPRLFDLQLPSSVSMR